MTSTFNQKTQISPLPVETTGQTANWSKLGISPRSIPHHTPFLPVSPGPHPLKSTRSRRSSESPKNSPSHYSIESDSTPFNIPFYTNITKKVLNEFYPKHCPNCNDHPVFSKEISTRPDVIRCEICRYQCSRLSYTPLNHFKLPLWMFGFVFYEALIQHPKVLTSTEIARRLKISYKAAALLKRRFQLLCSDLLAIYKDLTYRVL
ncbi:hypothetical protein LEP1GSC040_0620 [Leptospira santarosai str. 2000030832]|nr:hypothetical protein LEP1GSC040_0620 [Leptospira santarosai str. 2000030832]